MNKIDTISVVVPTYNDPEYLYNSIDSIFKQTIDNVDIEIILIDSSSTNSVRKIAEAYKDRVRYEWTKPEGVAAARNYGIKIADGDAIGFCDADDYWHPKKLEYQVPRLRDGADIVYSNEFLVLSNGDEVVLKSIEITDPETHYIKHFRHGGVGSRSVLVRTECLENNRFDESLTMREDPHLWTRLFAEYQPARIDTPLSYKRKRENSLTENRDEAFKNQLREISDLVDRYPELRKFEKKRVNKARQLYAKTLIEQGDQNKKARIQLKKSIRPGNITVKALVLLLITYLPIRSEKIYKNIRVIYWFLKNW